MTPVRLRVRELRDAKGWSQSELARRANMSRAALANLEAGKTKGVDFATLDALATALGCDAAFLVVQESAPTTKRGKAK